MRTILAACLVLVLAVPALAESPTPYSGTKTVDTGQPFSGFVKALLGAIEDVCEELGD